MQSALFKEPYEKGLGEGKSITLIRLLTKKFGVLPTDLKKKIEQTEMVKIDLMIDEVLDYKSLDEVIATLS